jgi:hypothetical protein
MKMFDALGGRKLIGFVMVFVVLSVKLFVSDADTSSLVTGIVAALGAFVAGNAAEHFADKGGKNGPLP